MKLEKNKNIYKLLIYILILLPIFKIPYFNIIFPYASYLYIGLSFISFLIVILLVLKDNLLSKFELLSMLFMVIYAFITIINNGDIKSCISTILEVLTIVFVVRYGLKNNPSIFLNALELILFSLVFINFITIIIFKDGLYTSNSISFLTDNNWFLGFKNNHITYIIPAILISTINSVYKKNKISFRTIFLILISIFSVIKVKSSTSIVGVALILILYLIIMKVPNLKLINSKSLFITYFTLFFSIVIFRLQELFKFLIVDILHKDITLTNRTYIWDYVINFLKEKPILGYGLEKTSVRYFKTSEYQSYHAHNQILEIFYQTGIVGISMFMILLILSLKELNKYSNLLSKTILIVLFSTLIIGLTEAFSLVFVFWPIVFGYNIKYLLKSEVKNENK